MSYSSVYAFKSACFSITSENEEIDQGDVGTQKSDVS